MKISNTKVVIIGAGMVGSATAFCLIVQGLCAEVVLVDRNMAKAEGEALDLRHSIEYQNRNVQVKAGTYNDCQDADIVIITASIPMGKITSRNELLEQNITIIESVTDEIMASGFDGHIIVVSNPVDVLSYHVYQRSKLPRSQVIGTGTSLETARLKVILGDIINIDPRSIHAYAIGEHGESMMVPWSHVRVGGKSLYRIIDDNPERFSGIKLSDLITKVKEAGFEVFNRKGSTQFGIASATCAIVGALLRDEKRMLSVSALLDGEYGQNNVFCGIPAIIGKEGVIEITEYHLDGEEYQQFISSVSAIKKLL